MFTKSKKAFTIVELVIVIAVIAILMGIMFVGGTAISNNAKASTLDSDLRTFETNLKAMVNDPSATDIQTKAGGFDPADVSTLINSYFEGDIALSGAFEEAENTGGNSATDVLGTGGAKANRAAWEVATTMKDPYGIEYRAVVLDNSNDTVTDITFLVYSCGKNKQTSNASPAEDNDGMFDIDDVARVVRVVDSVIYTGTYEAAKQATPADKSYMEAAKLVASPRP